MKINLELTKTIKKLKSNEVKLRFPNIGQVEKAQLVLFSDASLAKPEEWWVTRWWNYIHSWKMMNMHHSHGTPRKSNEW